MRSTILLLAVLALAGCADKAPPAAAPEPETHLTDCHAHPNAATCTQSTRATPLALRRVAEANASRVMIAVSNGGEAPVRFEHEPPAVELYRRAEDAWDKIATPAGEAGDFVLAPGANVTLAFHYGRDAPKAPGDVRYEPLAVPEPWPEGVYRLCASARLDGAEGWTRVCGSFPVARAR